MDVCACSATTAPSYTKRLNAFSRLSVARTIQKGESTESYYGTLVYYDLPCTKHGTKVYREEALKMTVARPSKYKPLV